MTEPQPLCIYEKRDPISRLFASTVRRKRTPSAAIFTGRSMKPGIRRRMMTTSGRLFSRVVETLFAPAAISKRILLLPKAK